MKTIQKIRFCFAVIILFAANANAGRWLTHDPIVFMERDSHPWDIQMPRMELPDNYQQQANLYTFVDNNPINEIDPLGLWGVQFGNVNFGYGNPNLAFDSGSYDDLGQGAQATLDGINPFGNYFLDHGGYDPCDKTLAASRALGQFARNTYLSTVGIRGLARLGASRWPGTKWINSNRYLRFGESGNPPEPTLRIGQARPPTPSNHIPLTLFGN